MKKCSKCESDKKIDKFYKKKESKDGLRSECKTCTLNQKKQHYGKHKDVKLKYDKEYRKHNAEKIRKYKSEYYIKNKEDIKSKKVIYRKYNIDKIREYNRNYQNNRLNNDSNFKLTRNLRARLNKALKGDYKTGSAVSDLGCSIKELKQYLESLFVSDMTWDNYGLKGWHIDHVKALTNFDLTNREELLKACHYTNLKPMWAKDNISKGNKL